MTPWDNRTGHPPKGGGVSVLDSPTLSGTTVQSTPTSKRHENFEPVCRPRLLTIQQAADYLNVSYWTARDWLLQELIPVIALPPLRPREGERAKRHLRRVLVDRVDLDRFIEERKR